jgi:hypothetical protein
VGDKTLGGEEVLVEGIWVSEERMFWGRGVNFEGEFRDELQLVALWPVFLQRKTTAFSDAFGVFSGCEF